MKTVKWMLLVLQIVLVSVTVTGCATMGDALVGTTEKTLNDNISPHNEESMYDKMWREGDEDWHNRWGYQ